MHGQIHVRVECTVELVGSRCRERANRLLVVAAQLNLHSWGASLLKGLCSVALPGTILDWMEDH